MKSSLPSQRKSSLLRERKFNAEKRRINKLAKQIVKLTATPRPVKVVDPERIFGHARAFEWACSVLGEKRGKIAEQKWSLPMGTNAAFTLELYLKCLLVIERDEYFEGHDLKRFFCRLKGRTQNLLRAHHAEFIKDKPDFKAMAQSGRKVDLETLLKEARNSFMEFRYAYEEPYGKETSFALGGLILGIKQIIFERFPEWHVGV